MNSCLIVQIIITLMCFVIAMAITVSFQQDLPFPVLIGSFTVEGDIDEAYLALKDPCPGLGLGLELLGKSPKSCNWLMWVYDF